MKGKKTDPIVVQVRDYPSLITKLRSRSALVRDLSSICFLKSANFRLAHGSRDNGNGKGRREDTGSWASRGIAPSRGPIVFTPSVERRNPAYRFRSLFTSSSFTNVPPPPRVLGVCFHGCMSTGSSFLGRHRAITRAMSSESRRPTETIKLD